MNSTASLHHIWSCYHCKEILTMGQGYWHLQECPEYQEYKRKRDA